MNPRNRNPGEGNLANHFRWKWFTDGVLKEGRIIDPAEKTGKSREIARGLYAPGLFQGNYYVRAFGSVAPACEKHP
jgi:hypothetical protein